MSVSSRCSVPHRFRSFRRSPLPNGCMRVHGPPIKNKQIWENVIDVVTGRAAGPEIACSLNELEVDERDNLIALRSVGQELSDAVAIAEKAAAGKAISGGMIKEKDQVNFVVVVLSDDRVKEVFLEPPRSPSNTRPTTTR